MRQRLKGCAFHGALCALAIAWASAAATPVEPKHDEEIIETLPAVSGDRAQLRHLRQQAAAHPRDADAAVALARRYLAEARTQGDPRYAGLAFAALAAWPAPAQAPDEVLLLQATLQQYVHDFDRAAQHLEGLVQRSPAHVQGWLTLATVRRVQGRYADSDRACAGLTAASSGPVLIYAQACQLENASLHGDFERVRTGLAALLATPRSSADLRNWLLTTLAESESRAGRPEAAEAAYRAAQSAQADAYTTLSYADFLLNNARPADALLQLKGQTRTDAVLLRLAMAGAMLGRLDGQRGPTARARSDAGEWRQRMALANLRPQARSAHAREAAMFALWVDALPGRALELARENVLHQREPLDLLLLTQAAAASHDPAARREAAALAQAVGLRDSRIDALL